MTCKLQREGLQPEDTGKRRDTQLTGTRDANLVASNDNDGLSGKKLLSNDACQTTEQMVSAVNNSSLGEHHGLLCCQTERELSTVGGHVRTGTTSVVDAVLVRAVTSTFLSHELCVIFSMSLRT